MFCSFLCPDDNCRVPHISLVFREMWDTAAPPSSFITANDGSGKDPWYPTSREKRARYGAPGNCGRDRENCKTLRSVHSILNLPQAG